MSRKNAMLGALSALLTLLGLGVLFPFTGAPVAGADTTRASRQASLQALLQTPPTAGPTVVITPVVRRHAPLFDHAYHITAEFGHYPNGEPHFGLDLDAWSGTPVHAPVGGTIAEVLRGCTVGDQGCGKGWGNHVWFRSVETGHFVLLAHFSRLLDWVANGTAFGPGTTFGESGATGFGTGPHVHIQVNPDSMGNPGSTNPAWEFGFLTCGEPVLGAEFGAAC